MSCGVAYGRSMTDPVPGQADPPAAATSALRRWFAPVVVVALMALGYAMGLQDYVSLQALADHRDMLRDFTSAHVVLALALFAAVYATAVALSFPGASALTVVGGFLFGWLLGGLAALTAATIGSMGIFLVARSSLGDVLSRRAGPALGRLRRGFADDAFNYLLFLRLVPLFPFWLVNIAAALTGMRLRTFAGATAIGIIPGTFAFAFLGGGLDSILDAQAKAHAACVAEKGAENCAFDLSVSSLVTTEMLVAFAALGLVALIPVGLKKWKSGT